MPRAEKTGWLAAILFVASVRAADGSALPPWTPGTLDIHQIATGRGNAALIIGPDGTSVMIDAGASNGGPDVTTPPRPDGTRRPGEWAGRYARRHLRAAGRAEPRIDYFVSSHLHPDHVGDIGPDTPQAEDGDFVLTGITDVAAVLPIGAVIDRGYPDYSYPKPFPAGFAQNYRAYIAWRRKKGLACERIRVGAGDQIRLRHAPEAYPGFVVRAIAADGVVWSGSGDATDTAVPPLEELEPADYPDENMCSIALKVSYGRFDYFTGGDLACSTRFGQQPWRDVETPAARATGPVEVAVANHHGYFDAVGEEAVRALRPRAWVVPVWHLTHLNIGVLERMLSPQLYPGPRDVFATDLMPATVLMNQRFRAGMSSFSGHVVVRVAPGGEEFRIYVTDNTDENDTVTAEFGPYRCR
jgi:Predicted hydrolase (metallo-beta-lactamase superfamily)